MTKFKCLNEVFHDVSIKKDDWSIFDVRIDIPSFGNGSDGINPHTQYSNPVVYANINGYNVSSVSFTLGDGNDIVCQCIKSILNKLDGLNIYQALMSDKGLPYIFKNIDQLRWLSPNSGAVYMASAAVLNALMDYAGKQSKLPLWKLLSISSPESLSKWIDTSNYSHYLTIDQIVAELDSCPSYIYERTETIASYGLPAYFTTWIGKTTADLANQIIQTNQKKGIDVFKIKLSADLDWSKSRVKELASLLPSHIKLAADFNQTLNFNAACEISQLLDDYNYQWIEEPFAPDNPSLHSKLKDYLYSNNLSLSIATGENCPNAHTALEFIYSDACDIFQLDACRVLSISDYIPILIACKHKGKRLIPHAGGSCLDELVPHLQAFNLCRINNHCRVDQSLVENVGFCSHLLSEPSFVSNGLCSAPSSNGFFSGTFLDIPFNQVSTIEPLWLKL